MSAPSVRIGKAPPRPAVIDGAGVLACAIVLAVAYLAGLAPRLRERAESDERQGRLDTARQDLARLTGERRDREAMAAALERKLASGAVHLRRARDVNERADEVVKLIGDCGLRVTDITPGTPDPREKFTVIPVRVRGRGGYAEVSALAAKAHERFPDTALSALTVAAAAPGESDGEFSVEFTWYAAPDGAARAPAPAPAK